MNDPIGGWMLPASMFGLMFGMGLALTLDDFRRIARVPGPVIAGTLLQLVAMPTVGFALALVYELPPLLAVGLVIVAACPGGMMSNMYVHLARANTALSVTLTATATAATLLTLPLWVRGILAATGDGSAVEIPLLETAVELGGLTVVPIALGMALRAAWPGSLRFERPLSILAALVIIGLLTYDGVTRPDPPTEQFVASVAPTLWLLAASVVLGLGVPWLLGHPAVEGVTIGVELCVKNGLLGMVVASSSFGVLEPSIPILAYTAFMTPVGVVMLIGYRWRAWRLRG